MKFLKLKLKLNKKVQFKPQFKESQFKLNLRLNLELKLRATPTDGPASRQKADAYYLLIGSNMSCIKLDYYYCITLSTTTNQQ